MFYVGGYLLMPALEAPRDTGPALSQSSAGRARTVLDVAVPGHGEHWHKFEEILAETDVFLPNSDEAEIITGLSDPRAQAERFRAAGARTVVITQGERGTLLVEDGQRMHSGVYPTTFVGGTGAGDAFDAGFIAGMLAGEDSAGCLRWGSAFRASCVRGVSATDSVFNRAEAIEFMARHGCRLRAFSRCDNTGPNRCVTSASFELPANRSRDVLVHLRRRD